MRFIRSIIIYALAVFLGGALLAPWLYHLVGQTMPHSRLATNPFHRYVDRSLLGIALAGLWPLLRNLGVRTWREVGMAHPRGQWGRLATGLAIGFGSLACVALVVVGANGRALDNHLSAAALAGKAASAAATAIVVSTLEELLFRGAIFGALKKVWPWTAALLVSSMIYAIAHFLARAEITGPVTWKSGLDLLPRMLSGFGDLKTVIPGFFNLTFAGLILGYAYEKTGTLYFSIGLHAGWIFWLKMYGAITTGTAGDKNWLWGTQKLIDGWLALAILVLAFMVVLKLLSGKTAKPETL